MHRDWQLAQPRAAQLLHKAAVELGLLRRQHAFLALLIEVIKLGDRRGAARGVCWRAVDLSTWGAVCCKQLILTTAEAVRCVAGSGATACSWRRVLPLEWRTRRSRLVSATITCSRWTASSLVRMLSMA